MTNLTSSEKHFMKALEHSNKGQFEEAVNYFHKSNRHMQGALFLLSNLKEHEQVKHVLNLLEKGGFHEEKRKLEAISEGIKNRGLGVEALNDLGPIALKISPTKENPKRKGIDKSNAQDAEYKDL